MVPNYTLIEFDDKTFFNLLKQEAKKKHTVVRVSNNLNISQEKILLLLESAKSFKKSGLSFVVVLSGVNVEDFPEELPIAPTLQEAEDILEMEAIERDLGF